MRRKSRFWFKNEKELMRSLGLNPAPGSGNGIIKEDGQNEYLIAQLKSTDKDSTTIKMQDLNSLFYNAAVSGKTPVFINQFINGPILLTMRIEDALQVCEYLQFQKTEKREILHISEEGEQAPIVSVGNRKTVMNKIRKEREERYNKGRR